MNDLIRKIMTHLWWDKYKNDCIDAMCIDIRSKKKKVSVGSRIIKVVMPGAALNIITRF